MLPKPSAAERFQQSSSPQLWLRSVPTMCATSIGDPSGADRSPAMAHRISSILRQSGVRELGRRTVAYVYRTWIRRMLPTADPLRYAGVPVAVRKWGDTRTPVLWRPMGYEHYVDLPEYEAALVRALREHVVPGDRVTVIGGGYGVTVAVAALAAAPDGRVCCFEGSLKYVEKVLRTAALNGVADRVVVRHAIVGRGDQVYAGEIPEEVVLPEDLTECEVLELDCEGDELEILRRMTIRPRAILVETHGAYGSPTPAVRSLLEEIGYHVTDAGIADSRHREVCIANDIRVLVACRVAPAE